MKKKIIASGLIILAFGFQLCKQKEATPVPPVIPVNENFVKGADVGWITEMESAGVKFYSADGIQKECMQLLKEKGITAIRLRAWVNPTDGWNGTKDLVVKAKRAKDLGMKIMIDFHYSDTWADPGKQSKPKAWLSLGFDALKSAMSAYTVGVIDTLMLNGITPDWIQIGNESNDGMLWEDGRASKSMSNFAALVKVGYDAVKSVSPTTKVIVHLSNGYDNALFRWMFDGLKSNGATWDIIGMSLYPSYAPEGAGGWSAVNTHCLANMTDLISRYGTPVMIVEVGMPVNDAVTCKAFLKDIINKTKTIADGNGLGVFYWEPEAYNWEGYGLGAFDVTGKPTAAMDAFSEN